MFSSFSFLKGIYIEKEIISSSEEHSFEERSSDECSPASNDNNNNNNNDNNNNNNNNNDRRNKTFKKTVLKKKIFDLKDLPEWTKNSEIFVNSESNENYGSENSKKDSTDNEDNIKNIKCNDNDKKRNDNNNNDNIKKNNDKSNAIIFKEIDAYHRVLRSVLKNQNKNEYFPSVYEVIHQWNIFDKIFNTNDRSMNIVIDDNDNKYNYNVNNNANDNNNNNGNKDNNNNSNNVKSEDSSGQRSTPEIMLRTYSIGSSIESIMKFDNKRSRET